MVTLNKENAKILLINAVLTGQSKGAYHLRETPIIKKAVDYWNPDVKEKPTFENLSTGDPDLIAFQVLTQCVTKSQAVGAYDLNEAATLHSVIEFLQREYSGPSSSSASATTKSDNNGIATKTNNEDHPQNPSGAGASSSNAATTSSGAGVTGSQTRRTGNAYEAKQDAEEEEEEEGEEDRRQPWAPPYPPRKPKKVFQ